MTPKQATAAAERFLHKCATPAEKPPLASAHGWGAWLCYEWDAEEPMCVRCGTGLSLNDGCEWSEIPEANLCHSCAIIVIEEMRPNE
jgi:hypothetical protein